MEYDVKAVPDMQKYMQSGEGGMGPEASQGNGTQPVVAKLLVSNTMAGSVIGKQGSNIEQLQKCSNARIQLSRSGEFYPGTSDRVLLLSGSLHSVLTAIFLILGKVSRDSASRPHAPRDDEQAEEVKLALSRRLCGLLIGHKGQTVRDFMSDSGASIRVQTFTDLTPSDPERTITVLGARDQVLRAVALILNTLSMHELFPSYMETTLQLAANQGVILPPRTSSTRSVLSQARCALILYLHDDDVGVILGRRGQNIIDIQQSAKVMIKISNRNEMDPALEEREVTITGVYSSVKLAEAMIAEKLNQSHARMNIANGAGYAENRPSSHPYHEV